VRGECEGFTAIILYAQLLLLVGMCQALNKGPLLPVHILSLCSLQPYSSCVCEKLKPLDVKAMMILILNVANVTPSNKGSQYSALDAEDAYNVLIPYI
jgi:hypothetical protein